MRCRGDGGVAGVLVPCLLTSFPNAQARCIFVPDELAAPLRPLAVPPGIICFFHAARAATGCKLVLELVQTFCIVIRTVGVVQRCGTTPVVRQYAVFTTPGLGRLVRTATIELKLRGAPTCSCSWPGAACVSVVERKRFVLHQDSLVHDPIVRHIQFHLQVEFLGLLISLVHLK